MKLRNVSRYFQEAPVLDGYSGATLFYAHTTPHDDHTSSGSTARRRTMTVDIDKSAPARRVVSIFGEYWIVGNSNLDSFKGAAVKKNFGLKKATELATLRTPGQACLAAGGTSFYIQREYFRNVNNPMTESDLDMQWNVFCPFTETLVVGSFLVYGSRMARIRDHYSTVDEYQVAEADQMDADVRQAVTFTTTGAIDTVTDLPVSTSVATYALQFEDVKFYRFRDEAEAVRKPGDKTVFVAASAVTPLVNATFTMLGQTWRVMQVQAESDAWALQVRLA